MDIAGFFETHWQAITGAGLFALVMMLISGTAAYKIGKRKLTKLLDEANGRAASLAQELGEMTERATSAEADVSTLSQTVESMKPEIFDSKIEEIVTHINDVERSRFDEIIGRLNGAKVGTAYLAAAAQTAPAAGLPQPEVEPDLASPTEAVEAEPEAQVVAEPEPPEFDAAGVTLDPEMPSAEAMIDDVAETATDAAHAVGDAAAETAEDATDAIREATAEAAEAATDAISEAVAETAETVAAATTDAAQERLSPV